MLLNKAKILELFQILNNRLETRSLRGEIGVVGGAALCILFNERSATKDVDAIFEPTSEIRKVVKEVSEDEGIPEDWLNDAVKGFMPQELPQETVVYSGSNLKVWTPNLEYLFAMKAMASRADTTDLSDIKLLINKMNIKTLEEAVLILHKYYPKGKILQKTYYFLEELFDN